MNTVLFVCRGNACRSRLAEALFNHGAPKGWKAESAGWDPVPWEFNPPVLTVLQEIGVPFQSRPNRRITREMAQQATLVVRLCQEEVPELGGRDIFWDVKDPTPGLEVWQDDGNALEAHRQTRDQIAELVRKLWHVLREAYVKSTDHR